LEEHAEAIFRVQAVPEETAYILKMEASQKIFISHNVVWNLCKIFTPLPFVTYITDGCFISAARIAL
jgi:hypothetical protein